MTHLVFAIRCDRIDLQLSLTVRSRQLDVLENESMFRIIQCLGVFLGVAFFEPCYGPNFGSS